MADATNRDLEEPYLLEFDAGVEIDFGDGGPSTPDPDPLFSFNDPDCATDQCNAGQPFRTSTSSAFDEGSWLLEPLTLKRPAIYPMTGRART